MLTKLIASLSLAAFLTVLTGCNTMQGVGEDVSEGGEALQEAAE